VDGLGQQQQHLAELRAALQHAQHSLRDDLDLSPDAVVPILRPEFIQPNGDGGAVSARQVVLTADPSVIFEQVTLQRERRDIYLWMRYHVVSRVILNRTLSTGGVHGPVDWSGHSGAAADSSALSSEPALLLPSEEALNEDATRLVAQRKLIQQERLRRFQANLPLLLLQELVVCAVIADPSTTLCCSGSDHTCLPLCACTG